VLKDGAKLKKNKLKWDTNIILGGQKYNLGGQNYFFSVFKDILKTFGGHSSPLPKTWVRPCLEAYMIYHCYVVNELYIRYRDYMLMLEKTNRVR
jgi:hypothetical protein